MSLEAIRGQLTTKEFHKLIQQPRYSERRFELIDGEVFEKACTEEQGCIMVTVGAYLLTYLHEHNVGRAMIRVQYSLEYENYNSLLPDVSLTLNTERPLCKVIPTPYLPDVAIDVKTPLDKIETLRKKADYYLANGTSLVWLLLPATRQVEIHSLSAERRLLEAKETLNSDDLLPGFSIEVAKLFE